MPITRRALLISNAGEVNDPHYCKGVFADIAAYQALLPAAHGGSWNPLEIQYLDRPTKADVRYELGRLKHFDYSFIAFAGHGYFSTIDRATVLKLRANEELNELELRKDAGKRTIILDCCRELRNKSAIEEQRSKTAMLSASASYQRTADPQCCREKFDLDVLSASPSLVVMHSSTPPELSGDDQVFGGYYTSSLMIATEAWKQRMADEAWNTPPRAYSTAEVHEGALPRTRLISGGTQNPYIEKPRTNNNYFPFAVFA